ncbi:MAG: dTDP-4-dehydrorhamnose reductase [Winogradskyella sp.]|uniref:dTDP-4-dehydrorhamnose reductase n=1 Tax=Winogradskyella sp. TaxID=1883156 RepID=UPI0017B0DE5F|nr:dTDP-4-dehydrorhamnose reductase [Winogradskyella sp.]
MKTRVLVTGSNGQLGTTLKQLFLENSDAITFDFCDKSKLDITSINALSTQFNTTKYQFCINCAAFTNVELAATKSKDAYRINAEGVKNLAEVCKQNNTTLIHISTDYVFDGNKHTSYNTTDCTNPINEYGRSKLQGELYIKELLSNYYIIRASWLYSANGNNFVNSILNKLIDGANLSITTSQRGTPTSCIDLSNFIYYILKAKIPFGIYHFSAKGSTTWFGFAKEIIKQANSIKDVNITPVDNFKTIADRPKNSVLNISKTEKEYRQLPNWKQSLKEVMKLLRNN